jgi:methyl-accepting chemotaxis protein
MTVRAIINVFTWGVGIAGMALLIAALAVDPRWAGQGAAIAGAFAIASFLRASQLGLTKYSSLNLLGPVAIGGALTVGAPATAVALYVGVLLCDWLLHRKPVQYAWINAGREVLALVAAYGLYAWMADRVGTPAGGLFTTEGLPAAAVLVFGHFIISRALLYFTLLVRDKLLVEEKSLILRYEVIAFGGGSVGVAVALLTIQYVGVLGWLAVGVMLLFAGLLFRRILEESIAAEELNHVHEMEKVVAANVGLAEALLGIERLAHRLVDWSELKVYRLSDGSLRLIYARGAPMVDAPAEPAPAGAALRELALAGGEPIIVTDALKDARVDAASSRARSMLVVPLRFGDSAVGLMEIEHHRRGTYGQKEVQLVQRFANQLATTLHIHDLRQPLLEAAARVGAQLETLTESARALRGGGEGVARNIAEITRGIAEESEQAGRSLQAAQTLQEATASVVRDGGDAATASRRATSIAAEHRGTIATALDRLVDAKGFVSESAGQIDELAQSTRRLTGFLGAIRALAEQTNLLSFNAAIEAARAGERGRGFAVVADEVRKLADQSARASDEAAEILLNLEEQMRRVARQMSRGQGMVSDVETLSGSALQALDEIVSSTAASLEHAERIARVSRDQETEFGRLSERVSRIAEISRRNRTGAENVTSSAREQASALRELEGATHEIRTVAVHLGELTRRITSV